jgi:RNA polymerase sigma-54 factor
MRFETSQAMKMGQSMKLAPRMIQSMEILQMPLAELEERLRQELESNPTLEQSDGDATLDMEVGELDGAGADDALARARLEQRHRDRELEGLTYRKATQTADGRDAKLDAMAAQAARSVPLVEQLREQWGLVEIEPRLIELGFHILGFVEEDGALRTPLPEIASRANEAVRKGQAAEALVPELERALRALQLFLEPAGVLARDAQECLLLQLDAIELEEETGWPVQAIDNARLLVREHLQDLMQNRLPRVAERSKLTMEQIKEALTLLKRLSLAPGRRLVETRERPIVPDAIVEYDPGEDRYFSYLNDAHVPTLRINEEYARLSKDKALEKRDREFIKTNLGNAHWLLDAVSQRKHTLLRVVRKVVEHQRDFFELGPSALKPLPMTQVASELGIHVATVSRAVAEKFIATPRGVLALRKFFSGGLQTQEGDGVAWEAVRSALKDLIDGESKASPLSDDALSDALKERGMDIARRTVAKYREQMGIPTARLRKAF